uniref:F-box domain-containing protein n=1 Tax=viral metagenome TaxID=1070528 RepID=A0A6C0JPJ6_9ZZZZ
MITDLPLEVQEKIFTILDVKNFYKCRLLSKNINSLILNVSPINIPLYDKVYSKIQNSNNFFKIIVYKDEICNRCSYLDGKINWLKYPTTCTCKIIFERTIMYKNQKDLKRFSYFYTILKCLRYSLKKLLVNSLNKLVINFIRNNFINLEVLTVDSIFGNECSMKEVSILSKNVNFSVFKLKEKDYWIKKLKKANIDIGSFNNIKLVQTLL